MMNETENIEIEQLGFLNVLILILSIYVIFILFIDAFLVLPTEISKLLNYTDNIVCLIFLYDFILRFKKSTNKLDFMKWGWIDLISCIPTFDMLRYGRFLRIIRLLRIIRAFKSTKHLFNHLFKNKIQGTFSSVIIIAILMLLFSSVSILYVENDPNSNIKNAEDAIWWAFTTITTVGYGDRYPITTEGRLIAAVLMIVGVGLFGTFTGFITNWFLGENKNK